MLRVEQLQCRYGKVAAVHDLSIEVPRGELVVLIGANGAGKTTTLKAIAGALAPAGGRVVLEGRDVAGVPAHELVQCPPQRLGVQPAAEPPGQPEVVRAVVGVQALQEPQPPLPGGQRGRCVGGAGPGTDQAKPPPIIGTSVFMQFNGRQFCPAGWMASTRWPSAR